MMKLLNIKILPLSEANTAEKTWTELIQYIFAGKNITELSVFIHFYESLSFITDVNFHKALLWSDTVTFFN